MQKRGAVWISPEGYVPSGRMIDPAATEFGASWQDERVLEDATFYGAEAAIAWGRERSSVVHIRLGHSFGTYFSAGDEHPPVDEDDPNWPVPPWPPETPPPDGWYYPPQMPTLEDALAVRGRLEAGEIDSETVREWAEECIVVHGLAADEDLMRALWTLRDTDEPLIR